MQGIQQLTELYAPCHSSIPNFRALHLCRLLQFAPQPSQACHLKIGPEKLPDQ